MYSDMSEPKAATTPRESFCSIAKSCAPLEPDVGSGDDTALCVCSLYCCCCCCCCCGGGGGGGGTSGRCCVENCGAALSLSKCTTSAKRRDESSKPFTALCRDVTPASALRSRRRLPESTSCTLLSRFDNSVMRAMTCSSCCSTTTETTPLPASLCPALPLGDSGAICLSPEPSATQTRSGTASTNCVIRSFSS
ncbi:hypothetical protein DQ04_02581050 [Trypanosoma grayi]|uniref:hypothetical protein n=1 Tax=Trypanosoma grayi TaxID=71804 RepID=UPI0004F41DDC|nr:hypothetical protein DQ04_02581050 [Trypanosoma grayi]KEG11477.1 hypothetical protein DQ04_02581050 [Trypanosoma grayi]